MQLAVALDLDGRQQDAGLGPVTLVFADQALNDAVTAEGMAVDDPRSHPWKFLGVKIFVSIYSSWLKMNGHQKVLWQGRFKVFPIQEDDHLLVVLRYIERNPLRAHLVERAEQWPWSSLAAAAAAGPHLDPGPVPRGADWAAAVNAPMFETEIEAIRLSLRRNAPFGSEPWVLRTAAALGLESSLRNRGNPRLTAGRRDQT